MITIFSLYTRVITKKHKPGLYHKKCFTPAKPIETTKKAALNIPGYYEDIVNHGKLKKTYAWELS
jgi:hypothetical protein